MSNQKYGGRNIISEAADLIKKRFGIRQGEIADQLGLADSSLSDLIKGRSKTPSRQTLLLLNIRYGLRLDWLATGAGKPFLSKEEEEEGVALKTFGDRLTYFLTCMGDIEAQHKTWERVHTEKGEWDAILAGEREPDSDFLMRLRNHFGYTNLWWVLSGEGRQPPPPGHIEFYKAPELDVENTVKGLQELEAAYLRLVNENEELKAEKFLLDKETDRLQEIIDDDERARPTEKAPGPLFPEGGGTTEVPLYDVKAAAGAGEWITEETLERHFEFSNNLLVELGAHPQNVIGVRVRGDSMEPELFDGDIALVDRHRHAPAPATRDVYLFSLDNELFIKVLAPLEDGGAIMASQNPDYPQRTLDQNEAESLQVIGRVFMRWRDMI